ncbi:hypothetical protein [Flavobacterium sp. 7A]|uniref:hypothetical protein n=1 Tax=Flavobacterium sp. 7A TaxID=2940571 RepID=UPI0022262ED3|nr:hypothetical protein [Flavobacterium sp. 7A]MCW2118538.1 hypothetical protein [Flavobacterium sp. 7A]
MAFELDKVVPWGRSLAEYIQLFNLTNSDLDKKIISFGDGPASFNSEMYALNKTIISLDPLYQFTKNSIEDRISETKVAVMEQMKANQDNYIWTTIKNTEELEQIRMQAMSTFIKDFEVGKRQRRYINHELPNPTNYMDLEFELGLSSHFLILYSQLGLDFHLKAISEMLRISKEIRIFPILDLNGGVPDILYEIIKHFNNDFCIRIDTCEYEFQKNGNRMLVILHK